MGLSTMDKWKVMVEKTLGSLHSAGRVSLWATMALDLWSVQVGSKVDSLCCRCTSSAGRVKRRPR